MTKSQLIDQARRRARFLRLPIPYTIKDQDEQVRAYPDLFRDGRGSDLLDDLADALERA